MGGGRGRAMCRAEGVKEVVVCDVVRDRVLAAMRDQMPAQTVAVRIPGDGTRITCVASERTREFQERICRLLRWGDDAWRTTVTG